MQVLRKLRRPRPSTALGCLAATAAAVVVATGVAPPGARSAAGQADPVVDPTYMYGQLFNMGYDDVYRVSGADGDPRNFSRSVQHPVDDQRVAGVLEELEDAADRAPTPWARVAKFATASDHYFRRAA